LEKTGDLEKNKKIPDAVVLASRWMNESEKPGKGTDECHAFGMCWNMVFFARGLGYLSGAKVSSNSP
jgi:hypothetical protein